MEHLLGIFSPNIGKLKRKRNIPKLIEALRSSDFHTTDDARDALAEIEEAVEPLCSALNLSSGNIYNIIAALGCIGSPEAVEALLKFAEKHKKYCSSTIRAFEEIADSRSVPYLCQLLKTAKGPEEFDKPHEFFEHERNVTATIQALKAIGNSEAKNCLYDALEVEAKYIRYLSAKALKESGDLRVEESVCSEILKQKLDLRVLISKLGIDYEFADIVTKSDDKKIVEEAALILIEIFDQRLRANNERSELSAVWAAQALGELEDSRAVDPLVLALWHQSSSVRMNAARSLGNFKSVIAVQGLLLALKDEDKYVRKSSAISLGLIGDGNAVEGLIYATSDKYWAIRKAAVKSLGWISDPKAKEALTRSLSDPNVGVRLTAAWSLDKISAFEQTLTQA